VVPLQAKPFEQVELAQQGWFAPPQATQEVPEQTPDVQLDPQHDWPMAPQLPQDPCVLQAEPSLQAEPVGQQGWPVPPHSQAEPTQTPFPPLHMPAVAVFEHAPFVHESAVHSLPSSQFAHEPPAVPQAGTVVPGWQILPSQHVVQQLAP
jgi:hypothetical protein